jgi:hypothetical protein
MLLHGSGMRGLQCMVSTTNRDLEPFKRKWQSTVAISSLMKNEHAEDVKGFIAYHRYIGVDKFYIRENSNGSAVP